MGSYATPSFFGTYDQAGNVTEMLDNKVLQVGGSYSWKGAAVARLQCTKQAQGSVKIRVLEGKAARSSKP